MNYGEQRKRNQSNWGNDFKKLKNKGIDPDSQIIQVLADHGLDESDLSDSECRRIVRAVNGY